MLINSILSETTIPEADGLCCLNYPTDLNEALTCFDSSEYVKYTIPA